MLFGRYQEQRKGTLGSLSSGYNHGSLKWVIAMKEGVCTMVDLPSNLASTAASSVVRQAEDAKKAETIAKRAAEIEKRRREDALREAANAKRTPGTSGR